MVDTNSANMQFRLVALWIALRDVKNLNLRFYGPFLCKWFKLQCYKQYWYQKIKIIFLGQNKNYLKLDNLILLGFLQIFCSCSLRVKLTSPTIYKLSNGKDCPLQWELPKKKSFLWRSYTRGNQVGLIKIKTIQNS